MAKQKRDYQNNSPEDGDADKDSVDLERGDAMTAIAESHVKNDRIIAEGQASASSVRSPERKRVKSNTESVAINPEPIVEFASAGESSGKTKYGKLGINDDRFFTVFEQVMPAHVWWSAEDLFSLLRAVPKGSIGEQRVCWESEDHHDYEDRIGNLLI